MYEPDNNPFAADGNANLTIEDRFATAAGVDDDQQQQQQQPPPQQEVQEVQPLLLHGDCGCRIANALKDPDIMLTIVDAGKSSEGSGGTFIAYTIHTGRDLVVRRRYSEFESLRGALTRLYPTLVIPPIPEKHAISDYATHPTRAKEDVAIIDHRKRMLQVFLNRLVRHETLRADHVVHRFLDSNASWSEVLVSPPISLLPKNVLKGPPVDPFVAKDNSAYECLPTPSASGRLKDDTSQDPAWIDIEARTKELEGLLSGSLEKVNRRILKRYGELSADFAELGAAYNVFSLGESGPVSVAIEKMGQASDLSYLAMHDFASSLNTEYSEPLAELSQTAGVVRNLLRYRHQKALQHEQTAISLTTKQNQLDILERSEQEAKRIDAELAKHDVGRASAELQQQSSSPTTFDSGDQQQQQQQQQQQGEEEEESPKKSSPNKVKKRLSGSLKVFGKLNHAIQGMIDVDPEATRRNNIGKTRENIVQLEAALKATNIDIKVADEAIRHELERYQVQKQQDMRRLLVAYAGCMIEWSKRSLEYWQDAKLHIVAIQ